MKIKDKRNAFYRLVNSTSMSFAYLDEVDFDTLLVSRPPELHGIELSDNVMTKVDADRSFIIFTTNREEIGPNCTITSSSGAQYTTTKAEWSALDEGVCYVIPGIKRGDVVKIDLG